MGTTGEATALLKRAKELLAQCQNLIFPPQCVLTGDRVSVQGDLSSDGWARLTFIAKPYCADCGIPFSYVVDGQDICGACVADDGYQGKITAKAGLDKIRAALVYDDVSAPLILGLKYADRHETVQTLARLMILAAGDLMKNNGTVIVPVPLHVSRLRGRRFNQAGLLAAAISNRLEVPVYQDFLVRRRATPQQQGLTAKARQRNVKSAFEVKQEYISNVAGGDFMLVDDVLTTGSTLQECARVLKRGGANSVSALVLARVVKEDIIAI